MRRRFYQILQQAEPTPDVTGEYLFLGGGQSNMGDAPATGRVSYSLMPSYLAVQQTLVKNWTGSEFQTYTHPSATQWGWWNEFLYRASQRVNKSIYSYKYGAGGTQLASGGPYTQYNKETLKVNGLNAINAFKALHPTGIVVFFWCHGYTDGLNEANSLAYDDNLSAFFAEMRAYWNIPDLLIIYDRLSTQATGSTYRANIRACQATVDAELVGGQDRNIMVDADDCPYQDTAHYGDEGSIILGQRMDTTLQLYY